ncbi:MAG: hypothetical protein PF495_15275 [Spirochaetales bacterium]|jgi:hypothetical protein|nr:hypothetical protein [Spirochaetales bacterium]
MQNVQDESGENMIDIRIKVKKILYCVGLMLGSVSVVTAYNFPCADECAALGSEWRPALGSEPDLVNRSSNRQLWGYNGVNPTSSSPVYSGSIVQSYLYVYSYGAGSLVAGEYVAYGTEPQGTHAQVTTERKKITDTSLEFSVDVSAQNILKNLISVDMSVSGHYDVTVIQDDALVTDEYALRCEKKQVWKFPMFMTGSSTLSWNIYKKHWNIIAGYYYSLEIRGSSTENFSQKNMGESTQTYKKCDSTVL